MEREQILTTFQQIISPEFNQWLEENDFYVAPAAINHHGNVPHGLMKHSIEVAFHLLYFTKQLGLVWKRPESPIIVGMLHDLCKIDTWEMVFNNSENNRYKWNPNTLYKGHGDKSVIIAASHIQLTDEEAACIRYHMGAFTDSSEWDFYTRAVKNFPNVLFTHTADMVASQIEEV